MRGKKLFTELREATRTALKDPLEGYMGLSKARGHMAQYMSELEDRANRFETLQAETAKQLVAADKTIRAFVEAAPAQMSTHLGLLNIDSDGMRTLIDEIGRIQRELRMSRNVIETYRNSGAKPSVTNSEIPFISTGQLFNELAKRFS
jgi:hypothetical protein